MLGWRSSRVQVCLQPGCDPQCCKRVKLKDRAGMQVKVGRNVCHVRGPEFESPEPHMLHAQCECLWFWAFLQGGGRWRQNSWSLRTRYLVYAGDKTTEILSQTRWKVVPWPLCALWGTWVPALTHLYTLYTQSMQACHHTWLFTCMVSHHKTRNTS